MKIPNKIHFCGKDYIVEIVKNLDGRDNWGRTSLEEQKIYLEKDTHSQKQEETFIHELIHIAYRNIKSNLEEKEEENLVKAWSKNIYGILKDNNLFK